MPRSRDGKQTNSALDLACSLGSNIDVWIIEKFFVKTSDFTVKGLMSLNKIHVAIISKLRQI